MSTYRSIYVVVKNLKSGEENLKSGNFKKSSAVTSLVDAGAAQPRSLRSPVQEGTRFLEREVFV